MSILTQAIKFAGIHDVSVGSLGPRHWASGRACPFFMSGDQPPTPLPC